MHCELCYAENTVVLGTLGNITHYRCRDCGMEMGVGSDWVEDPTEGLEDADIVGAWGPEGYFDVMDQYDGA